VYAFTYEDIQSFIYSHTVSASEGNLFCKNVSGKSCKYKISILSAWWSYIYTDYHRWRESKEL